MKVSLVIDGNYLLNKDVFILYEMKTLYSELNTLLWRDMNNLMKMYSYDTIYFISDSKLRWRKQYFTEYKQNRKPDDKIDWNYVYEQYDIFKNELREKSLIFMYEVDWLEGDDLISYIVDENNSRGISNIIMAADSDIKQKIKQDLGVGYINVMYNYKFSDEVTYWPNNYKIFLHEMSKRLNNSLFDMSEDNEFIEFLETINYKTKSKEVYSEEILFCKMVSGDKKDNVPSVFLKNNRGIGTKGGNDIYKLYKETYQENIDFDSDNFINKLTELISYKKKVTDSESIESIKNNLIRNRLLLKLDEKYLPSELREIMINKVKIY